MALSTKKILSRKEKVIELKEKHRKLFKLANQDYDAVKFIPKSAYNPAAGKEKVVSFFPSELSSKDGIYTEFVSKELVPEDPERRLWLWPFNPEWETEYETSDPHPATGHRRYLIPVDELIDVAEMVNSTTIVEDEKVINFDDLPDPDEDSPIAQMTIRDKAAIEWKLPVSKKKWLNQLIKETFKK